MVRYHGMIPALKYMVATTIRYQILRCHILSWVNMKPRNADADTVQMVPITVRITEM